MTETPKASKLSPVAIIDTQIISNLSHPAHQDAVQHLLKSLHDEGYAIAVTGTILSELASTKDKVRWQTHFKNVKQHCDFVIPIERGELVRLEIKGADPHDLILTKLFDARGFPDVLEARADPELWTYNQSDREWKHRLAVANSLFDEQHSKLSPADVPNFPTFLAAEQTKQALSFLNALRSHGVFEQEVNSDFANALLKSGFAFRNAVLLGIANQFDRIERAARGLRTKAGGSLSDMPVLSEAAYFNLIVTMDRDFARCGEHLKDLIPTPQIRLFKSQELRTNPEYR